MLCSNRERANIAGIRRIWSVCMNLPASDQPTRGLFVARRLAEINKTVPVRALNPVTWFPGYRRRSKSQTTMFRNVPIDERAMFYVPKVLKSWDAAWMTRTVNQWLDSLAESVQTGDILDAHFGYPEGVGCWRVASQRGLRLFVTLRGLEYDLFQQPDIGPVMVEALNRADGIVAVSHALCQAARAAGVTNRIEVIPNGVDSEFFSPGDRPQARQALGLDMQDRVIVCVGNYKPVKGHDVLFEAFARLEERRDLHLVCIGHHSDTAWSERLSELASQPTLAGRIHLLGPRSPDEIVQWLRAGDLFALASHREGCCNAVLEALACGLPVVATNVGENSGFIHAGINGQLAPPGDPAALAEALATALDTSFDYQRVAASVRSATWSHAADRTLDFMSDTAVDPTPCVAHPVEHSGNESNSIPTPHAALEPLKQS